MIGLSSFKAQGATMAHEFYTTPEVLRLLKGVTPQTLWRLRREHGFPKPFSITPGRNAYRRDAVDRWIDARAQAGAA